MTNTLYLWKINILRIPPPAIIKPNKLDWLKKFACVLVILLLPVACQKDDFFEENVENHSIGERTMTKIPYADFKKRTSAYQQALQSVFHNPQEGFMAKGVYDETLGVEIDTTQIYLIQNPESEYHTYTLGVVNNSLWQENKFKNLVLNYNLNDIYYAFMAAYSFNEESGFFDATDLTILTTENRYESIVYGISDGTFVDMCYSYQEIEPAEPCTCGGEHSYGQFCDCDPGQQATPGVYGWVLEPCQGGGGGTGQPTEPLPITTDPLNGYPGSSGSGGSTVIFDPDDQPHFDENGNPVFILTPPLNPQDPEEEEEVEDPCENLTDLLTNQDIKDIIEDLDDPTVFNLDHEKGSHIKDGNGTNLDITSINGNSNSTGVNVRIDDQGNSIVIIHSHFIGNRMVPLFTIEDLRTLSAMYLWRKHKNKEVKDLSVIVVSPAGVYAMGIKNYTKFAAEGNKLHTSEFDNIKNDFYEDYPKDQDLMQHADAIEKISINTLKDNYGVGLYKANTDLSGWNELTLDENDETQPNPCN
ncbi:MAG: hypothetical protein WD554_02845 [Flavobacteriaceae bacterium]